VLYVTVHISSTTQHSIDLFKFHVIPSFVIAPHKETDKKSSLSAFSLSSLVFTKVSQSHIILLVLVFLSLVAAFQVLLFVLHDSAIALHS